MKPLIKKLAAIEFTFLTLFLIQALLWSGAGISFRAKFRDGFTALNNQSLFDWLGAAWSDYPLVAAWLLILCLAAGLLMINALCCTLYIQLKRCMTRPAWPSWIFFLLHLMFIALLACHGMVMVSTQKHHGIRLFPGDRSSDHGIVIRLDSVQYTAGIDLLTMERLERRRHMTRKRFPMNENTATLLVEGGNHHPKAKTIGMLAPVSCNGFRITLKEFISRTGPGELPDDAVGVEITLTRNPWNRVFFAVYILLIGLLAGYLALTWKR